MVDAASSAAVPAGLSTRETVPQKADSSNERGYKDRDDYSISVNSSQ